MFEVLFLSVLHLFGLATLLGGHLVAQRVRHILSEGAALGVRSGAHVEHDVSTVHHGIVGEIVVVIGRAVESHGVHITSVVRVALCGDGERLAVLQMESELVEVRHTEHILVAAGTYRIEAHCREHIPCRGLTVVFVAAIAVGMGGVELVHNLTDPVLGLPRLT